MPPSLLHQQQREPHEHTVADSLIDHVFAPPGTSTPSSTVLATPASCSTTARFSPSQHEASRSCRNKNTCPIHALSYVCSLAWCELICSQNANQKTSWNRQSPKEADQQGDTLDHQEDIMTVAGVKQLCVGQQAGCEAGASMTYPLLKLSYWSMQLMHLTT